MKLKDRFPIFHNHPQLVYLDSGASSQKPDSVLKVMDDFYRTSNANIHRGVYRLSEAATAHYEKVRSQVADFLGGVSLAEVVFTSGTTESINLVASSWSQVFLKSGDEVLLTVAEHHSNIVPWQLAAERMGATVKYIPLTPEFTLDVEAARKLITEKTKILAFGHVSNVLGALAPVQELIALAKSVGAHTLIDGAQAVPHFSVDVRALGCDFYVFSSHKLFGPTGAGVLYGRRDLLEQMPPYKSGGDMIASVTLEGYKWAPLPQKFEAGTPPIADVIGLGAAIEFVQGLKRSMLFDHERALGLRVLEFLETRPKVRTFVKNKQDWVGVVAYHHEEIHPHDMAALLDAEGVCVRAGHHCAEPLMRYLGVSSTTRVSPSLYNDEQDIDRFIQAFQKVEKLFSCN